MLASSAQSAACILPGSWDGQHAWPCPFHSCGLDGRGRQAPCSPGLSPGGVPCTELSAVGIPLLKSSCSWPFMGLTFRHLRSPHSLRVSEHISRQGHHLWDILLSGLFCFWPPTAYLWEPLLGVSFLSSATFPWRCHSPEGEAVGWVQGTLWLAW